MLPLLDAFPFGKYILLQYPYILRAMEPVTPLYMLYNAVPFAPIILFLALYAGVVNNTSLSRFIRYNAMQAILLDILLIIPQVILEDIFHAPDGGLQLQLYITLCNTIFLFVTISVAYGLGSCMVGQSPRLPLVADAADQQIKGGPSGW